jgi:hypothetical protein
MLIKSKHYQYLLVVQISGLSCGSGIRVRWDMGYICHLLFGGKFKLNKKLFQIKITGLIN